MLVYECVSGGGARYAIGHISNLDADLDQSGTVAEMSPEALQEFFFSGRSVYLVEEATMVSAGISSSAWAMRFSRSAIAIWAMV